MTSVQPSGRGKLSDPKAKEQQEREVFVVSGDETPDATPAERSTSEIRQGHTGDHMRYVLTISLGIAVAAMLITLLIL